MWHKLFLGFSVVIATVVAVGYISIHLSQEELQNTIGKSSAELANEYQQKVL